jgi:Na+-driven multidrug efflux pump
MSISPSTPSLQVTVSSKQILSISLPIALAIMVPQVNFVINNIFLGALSSEALAIGGITGVFYLIFGVMGQGLNNGLQALISRRAGENRIDEWIKFYNKKDNFSKFNGHF